MALLSGLFKKQNDVTRYTYAKFLNNQTPIFSQSGEDIYYSDVVQMAINCIAEEIGKLQPKHIRKTNNSIEVVPNSAINRLFKFRPNELMTTKDFLEKIIWILYMQYNCFIYPRYKIVENTRGEKRREYISFTPLQPNHVDFLQDSSGKLFIKLRFRGGVSFTLRYTDIIHLRKKFSLNESMGGGTNGQPNNTPLRNIISTNDIVVEGIGKGVKQSLTIRGILKMNTMLEGDKLEAERKRFEEQIDNSESGIIAADLKGEYTPIKVDPKIIDKDTMEFIQNRILNWYRVPFKILSGEFNDEDYQAFWETCLNPLANSFNQAFSSVIFTNREISVGNEMVFYQQDAMFLSTKSKLDILKTMGEQGLLTDGQKLALMGHPPPLDGSSGRKTMSLNYINMAIADEYQLRRAGLEKGGDSDSNSET